MGSTQGARSMSHRPRPPFDQADSRLEFETLISDTSAALMTAMPEQVERVIEEALGRVREFFLGDRCALLEVSDDRQVARVRMASYAAGVDQVPSSMNLSAIFPWAARTLFQDRAPMRISRMADLLRKPAEIAQAGCGSESGPPSRFPSRCFQKSVT